MGFRIELEEEDLRINLNDLNIGPNNIKILAHLKENPIDVFGDPYLGYLFFLVGSGDEEIFSWLLKKVIALDSLTSRDVAFAIFAKKFQIKVDPLSKGAQFSNKVDLSIKELKGGYPIRALVNAGKCNWISDIDEINAITYGTDEVARLFGVMGDLPCVLVFDSVPKRKYEVFHLRKDNLQNFLQILRKTLDCLTKNFDYPHRQMICSINELQLEQSEIKKQIYIEQNKLPIVSKPYFKSIKQLRYEITSALKHGNIKRVRLAFSDNIVKSVIETSNINEVIEASQTNKDILLALARAINILETYSNHKWPLENEQLFKYIILYRKYIQTLLNDLPVNLKTDTSDQCIEIIQILISHQLKVIDDIQNLLPNDSIIEVIVKKLVNDKTVEIYNVIEELNERELKIKAQIKDYSNNLSHIESLSFVSCFKRESQENGIISTTRDMVQIIEDFAYVLKSKIVNIPENEYLLNKIEAMRNESDFTKQCEILLFVIKQIPTVKADSNQELYNILQKLELIYNMTVGINDKLKNISFGIFKIKLNSHNVNSNLVMMIRELEKLNKIEGLNSYSIEKLDYRQAEMVNELTSTILERLEELKILIFEFSKDNDGFYQDYSKRLEALKQSKFDTLLQRNSAVITLLGFVIPMIISIAC